MLTPLQQFIEIQEKVHTDQLKRGETEKAFATRQSIIVAKDLLGEEQSHIIGAYDKGFHGTSVLTGPGYFNKTYTQKLLNTMTHLPLKSSMLNSAGFDDGVIEVEFTTGKRFKYQATQDIFDELIRSDSPGKYFHAVIKKLPAATYGAPPVQGAKDYDNEEVDI